MTTYQIAQGKNNAAGLVTLNPQPRTPSEIQYEYTRSASGKLFKRGLGTVELEFTAFALYSDLTTFLDTYFNFTITSGDIVEDYVEVTFAMRMPDGSTYKNYNANAELVRPLQRQNGRFQPVTIRLTGLEAI